MYKWSCFLVHGFCNCIALGNRRKNISSKNNNCILIFRKRHRGKFWLFTLTALNTFMHVAGKPHDCAVKPRPAPHALPWLAAAREFPTTPPPFYIVPNKYLVGSCASCCWNVAAVTVTPQTKEKVKLFFPQKNKKQKQVYVLQAAGYDSESSFGVLSGLGETGKLTACLSLLCYSLASWFRHSSHDRRDSHVTCVRYLKPRKDTYKYIRRWPFLHWRHALVRLLLFHIFSFSSPSVQVSTARLWDMSKPLFLALFGLCFGLLSAFPTQEERGGKNWVVLVAGSNGWYNYRHQVRRPDATGLHQRVPATWRLGTCSPTIGHLTPIISTATVAALLLVKHRAAVSVCALSLSTRPPGRCVPCLPDRPQERHPRRADCGHDVRWPGHERGVSSVSFPPHDSATHLSHAFQFPSKKLFKCF